MTDFEPGTPIIDYSDDEEYYPLPEDFILPDTPPVEYYDSDTTMVVDWSDTEDDEPMF